MTNDTFRSELRNLRQEIETARRQLEPHFVPGLFETISIDPPPRHTHEVVFAIIAPWRNRRPSTALPFFSKLNLRQRADELNRLGLRVSIAQINDR